MQPEWSLDGLLEKRNTLCEYLNWPDVEKDNKHWPADKPQLWCDYCQEMWPFSSFRLFTLPTENVLTTRRITVFLSD